MFLEVVPVISCIPTAGVEELASDIVCLTAKLVSEKVVSNVWLCVSIDITKSHVDEFLAAKWVGWVEVTEETTEETTEPIVETAEEIEEEIEEFTEEITEATTEATTEPVEETTEESQPETIEETLAEEPEEEGSKSWIGLVIVGGVVVLLVLGGLAFGKKKSKKGRFSRR